MSNGYGAIHHKKGSTGKKVENHCSRHNQKADKRAENDMLQTYRFAVEIFRFTTLRNGDLPSGVEKVSRLCWPMAYWFPTVSPVNTSPTKVHLMRGKRG